MQDKKESLSSTFDAGGFSGVWGVSGTVALTGEQTCERLKRPATARPIGRESSRLQALLRGLSALNWRICSGSV